MKIKPGTIVEARDFLARYWIGAGIAKKYDGDGESTKTIL